MVNIERKRLREYAMNLLIIAPLAIIVIGTYFHQIQALLPVAALLLAVRIFLTSTDANVRRLSGVLSFCFGASTLSNMSWYMIPAIVDSDFVNTANYYYITGMFWLVGYASIAYVLINLKNSRQWYIDRGSDRMITAIAVIGLILVALLVFLNLRWDSAHVVDILVLLVYLCLDVIILAMTLKLLRMNLKRELRILVNAILLFFGINMLGDLLFECRWLFNLKSIVSFDIIGLQWSLNIRNTTDLIYEISLLLMTGCLFLYLIDPFRRMALDDARRRLKDTQLFVDDLVAKSPDATCVCNRDGQVLLVNDSFLRTFGLDRKNLGSSFNLFSYLSQIISDERISGQILNVRNGETMIIPKIRISDNKSGRNSDFFINLKIFPTYSTNGRIINYVTIIEDITERTLAEEALRESEEKFRVLAQSSSAMFWLYQNERFIYVNDTGERLTGYTMDELLRMRFWDVVHPDDRDLVRERGLARQRGELAPQKYDVKLLTKGGETRWVELTAGRIMYRGEPAGIATFFDITERRRAEDALRESEEKFRVLTEMAPVAICILLEGKFMYANSAMEIISGYSKEELLTINFFDMVHPDALRYIEGRYGEWLGSESNGEFRSRLKGVRKDGKVCWIDLSRKSINYQGRPALLLTGIDITERVQAEEALRESEEKYRSLVENINDMVWETDAEGKCTYASPKTRDLLGDEPEDVLGKTPFQYMIPEDVDRVREFIEPLQARHEPFGLIEYTVVHNDGTVVTIESSGVPRFDRDGRFKGYKGVNRDVTERKRAEEALRESEEKFRVLAETAPVAIVILQGDSLVYVNNAAEQQTGYTIEELLTMKPRDFINPDNSKSIERKLSPGMQGVPLVERNDVKIISRDGRELWMSVSTTATTYMKKPACMAICMDITERKKAEEALRESEERYRGLFETMQENFSLLEIITDREGRPADYRFLDVNPALERYAGISREQLVGHTHSDLTAGGVGVAEQKWFDIICRVGLTGKMESGEDYAVETGRWANYYAFSPRHGQCAVLSMDITERKRAEEALSKNLAVLAKSQEIAHLGSWTIDFDSDRLEISEEIYRMYGFEPGSVELTLEQSIKLVHPEDLEKYREQVESIRNGRLAGIDYRIVRPDGSIHYMHGQPDSVVRDSDGRVKMAFGIIQDITERKLAEDALRESEASLARAQTMAHIGDWEWDVASNKSRWSDELYNIYGLDKRQLFPNFETFLSVVHPDDRARIESALNATLRGDKPYNLNFIIVRPDGTERTIHSEARVVYDNGGKPVKLQGITQDITERVRLEKELFDAYNTLKEEYERRTDFTNAAAHELRTPLTPIIGYTDILKAEIKDERHRKYLEIIERNAIRQKIMVNRMLELASIDAGMAHVNSTEFPLLSLVNEVADNYRTINPKIRVDVPEGLRVTTDADIIRHVLDNLVSNAVKYSSNGAHIEIRAADDGEYYRLSVKDQGAGIPREEWDRIFERFYIVGGDKDNRTSGRVGLGLALVKAYINLIGGTVWLESEPGKGSTFFFTVPKVKQRSGQAANV